MNGAVVLLSGGLDSSVLLHEMKAGLHGKPLHALSFFYGQKHARELDMAREQAKRAAVASHRVIDLSFFKELIRGGSALTDEAIPIPDLSGLSAGQLEQPPTYVPNRNMMLLSLAAAFAEAVGVQDVVYGAQKQDRYGYWDCTVEFIDRINSLLALNRVRPVRVQAPFVSWSKADIVRRGVELGVDFSKTWSCYRGIPPSCGTCPTCVERRTAFRDAGVIDPCGL